MRGDLLNDRSTTYLYDRANRMISATLSDVTSLYAYNGDGVRLKQIIAGVPTTYTQDLAAPLPVVLQAKTGVTTTKYVYATGTRPLVQNSTAWEYLLSDGLGSVRQIVSANAYIIRAQDYEPYGTLLNSSGSGQSTYGFTGGSAIIGQPACRTYRWYETARHAVEQPTLPEKFPNGSDAARHREDWQSSLHVRAPR